MKKNVLALSIAAMIGGLGFAGAASAAVFQGTGAAAGPASATTLRASPATLLEIADAGTGHMLLVPYFTAQDGNMTVFHVVNTDTSNGKAVKVRFRSASNSDDILDFQVYMSPTDVWTAAVTRGPDGVAQIVTSDNTCTVPMLAKGVPQKFVQDRLNSRLTAEDKANHTREGYVEIFNMADIPSAAVYGGDGNARSALYTATKHASGVAPCSVAGSTAQNTLYTVATTNFTSEGAAAAAGLDTPTGGLMADWYIINVNQTTTFSGAATSIAAKTSLGGPAVRGNFVHFPQINDPVAAVDANNWTADPLMRSANVTNAAGTAVTTPVVQAAFYDLPDMSTPYVTATVDAAAPLTQATALTRSLAVTSVSNQYATDASISAKTDWVFSMPTRRYNVAANYAAVTDSLPANSTANTNYRLFTTLPYFTPTNTSVNSVGNICVNTGTQAFYDREERAPSAQGPVFSPGAPGAPLALCGEASVLSFASGGALGANVAHSTLTAGAYENGWGVINTPNGGFGLPILGSAFTRLTNPNVGAGISGNFGITWPHRFTRVLPQ